jgi:S1-C subfamily serine protease
MSTERDESRLTGLEAAAAKWSVDGISDSVDGDADVDATLTAIRNGLIDPSELAAADFERVCHATTSEERARLIFDARLDAAAAATTPRVAGNGASSANGAPPLLLAQPIDSHTSFPRGQPAGIAGSAFTWLITHRRFIMAAAALFVFGVSATFVLLQPPGREADLFASGGKSTPTSQISSMPGDRSLPRRLDVAPDFGLSDTATLGGPAKDPYFDWRLKTVIVRSADGHGSGALVGPRHVVTNYHVVESAVQRAAVDGSTPQVAVILPRVDGEGTRRRITRQDGEFKATVLRVAPERDLALVRLDDLPAGQTALPYFELAKEGPASGSKVIAIGSAGQGLAWGIKAGTAVRHRLPDDYTALQLLNAGKPAPVDRLEADVFATDCEIAPGYSGGPLCDEATGTLIGITFGAPAGDNAERAALHIALEHIVEFLKPGLDASAPAPLDAWTAGLPDDERFGPAPEDVDGDGAVDRIVIIMAKPAEAGPRQTARVEFIDARGRTTMSAAAVEGVEGLQRRLPRGLWGFATPGQFAFDAFIMLRGDGVVAIGYTSDDGVVDEIRIGNWSAAESAATIWTRGSNGLWAASKPSAKLPLLDAERLGEERAARIAEVWKQ